MNMKTSKVEVQYHLTITPKKIKYLRHLTNIYRICML